ncbi:Uncharacterised protein [Clostridioides difficile]|uniref:Uncharacterized protein n=1 Tax=Clostridioides difficile TaxID=1496 RepID=A0AAX3H3R2_CLODI|nr:hypothetical protein CDIF29020_03517 [Clostridioides difficile]SHO39260.1 hypothetical protein CDIFFM120_03431C [Clostridioides difficile M120]AXU91892.1 hypothetical protein CDIF29747_03431 [Clostridioides difficile]OMK39028.1 hypothetical protein BER34_000571 [Clostridioides difficile]OMK66503.1 hypothetical protein BER35_003387 [Clostridioides difficile]
MDLCLLIILNIIYNEKTLAIKINIKLNKI